MKFFHLCHNLTQSLEYCPLTFTGHVYAQGEGIIQGRSPSRTSYHIFPFPLSEFVHLFPDSLLSPRPLALLLYSALPSLVALDLPSHALPESVFISEGSESLPLFASRQVSPIFHTEARLSSERETLPSCIILSMSEHSLDYSGTLSIHVIHHNRE